MKLQWQENVCERNLSCRKIVGEEAVRLLLVVLCASGCVQNLTVFGMLKNQDLVVAYAGLDKAKGVITASCRLNLYILKALNHIYCSFYFSDFYR